MQRTTVQGCFHKEQGRRAKKQNEAGRAIDFRGRTGQWVKRRYLLDCIKIASSRSKNGGYECKPGHLGGTTMNRSIAEVGHATSRGIWVK